MITKAGSPRGEEMEDQKADKNKPHWLVENWPIGILFIFAAAFVGPVLGGALFLGGIAITTYLYLKLKEWEKAQS